MDAYSKVVEFMGKQNAVANRFKEQMETARKVAGLDTFRQANAIVDSLNAKNSVMAKVVGGVYHAPSAGDC